MQSFKPYIVIEDHSARLHLREPLWRKRVYFFVFRILPFFFLLQVVLLAFAARNEPAIPAAAVLFVTLITLVPAGILLSRAYNTEVTVTATGITIVRNSLAGKKELAYTTSQVEAFYCRKRRGKGGGLFYYLLFKSGQRRLRIVSIPVLLMSDAKRQYISERLRNMTGLEVRNA